MSDRTRQWKFISEALEKRKRGKRFRSLRPLKPDQDGVTVRCDNQKLINFCSNDYLGLSKHPALIERASQYAEEYGAGSTASRLISGTYEIHQKLEQKLATFFGTETALIFNSGFQANSTILQTLTDRNSLILADKRSHNSLVQGSLLSRAAFQRFDHNDPRHLQELLYRASGDSYNRILIITESVFSMDGDRADLDVITDLALQYNAMLFVDDAHAVGVWGEEGAGLAHNRPEIDITLGTFGKAFGVFGAFITCSKAMRDYLINFCPGFIYTTALPPPVVGAIDASLELMPTLGRQRKQYHEMIDKLRRQIGQAGFDTGLSSTQIIPIIVGGENDTLRLSEYLEQHGIMATAIRPPTVPESGSRIRITLSSKHSQQQLDKLVTTLRRWNES